MLRRTEIGTWHPAPHIYCQPVYSIALAGQHGPHDRNTQAILCQGPPVCVPVPLLPAAAMQQRSDRPPEVMIKYEIARQKAVDAWLEATTQRPAADHADVIVQIDRLRDAAHERQRLEVRRDWVGPPADLAAAVNAVARPDATDAMRHSAIETLWKVQRRARANQFPISDNLSALMALVMADLSETQRETLMNLIFQRNIELTALTLQQLRDFLITLFHAPKSSLENPSSSQRTGPRSFVSISYGELDQYEGLRPLAMKASLTSTRTSSGCTMRTRATG